MRHLLCRLLRRPFACDMVMKVDPPIARATHKHTCLACGKVIRDDVIDFTVPMTILADPGLPHEKQREYLN